jgi:tetratricopeptide (TPR) repeat protein
MPLHQQ